VYQLLLLYYLIQRNFFCFFGFGSFSEEGVSISAKALFFFGYGLPAFALVKVFSSFFFAVPAPKPPFFISFASVFLPIFIGIYYFWDVGFMILPIATSISSWFDAIILFIFFFVRCLFSFYHLFIIRFISIIFTSTFMGIFFMYLISIFV
jgi:Uncharacterized membrane protein, putative virulence factor